MTLGRSIPSWVGCRGSAQAAGYSPLVDTNSIDIVLILASSVTRPFRRCRARNAQREFERKTVADIEMWASHHRVDDAG